MDPNTTLFLVIDALRNSEKVRAVSNLRDLADWIEKGGFPPKIELVHASWKDGCDEVYGQAYVFNNRVPGERIK
jgi:hypothetical protein